MKFNLRIAVPLALLAALALVPAYAQFAQQPFYLILFGRIVIFAIAALSLDLIIGYGGMVSFGHALFLGLGAYTVAILSYHGIDNGFAHLAVTLLLCAGVGMVTGVISLRTTGIAFIMITLAFAQMFYFLAVSLRQYGGDDGLPVNAGSRFGGVTLDNPTTLYYTAFVVLCLCLWAGRRLVQARLGMVVRGARQNNRRMRALGFPTLRYKLVAYVVSAMVCGVAGMLYANLTHFVSPAYMAWTSSGEMIVMVVLGGLGSFYGPLLGTTAMLLTEEGLKALTEHWMIIFGPLILVSVLLSRRGLYGLIDDIQTRFSRRDKVQHGEDPHAAPCGLAALQDRSCPGQARRQSMSLLRADRLVKRYGGLLATDHFSFEVAPGELHAIIGPNGAGKSTLIAQLAGELHPDEGAIYFDEHDITALPIEKRAQAGLARSYQITSIFPEFTALQNVLVAVQAMQGHSFGFWKPALREAALVEPARELLVRVGLGTRMQVPAAALAHGEHRQLELAMALAGKPRLLLLDEPMAGMSQAESEQMTRLLAELKGDYAMVLVEHDMDAVFALADRITVLVYGRAIACGNAHAIRNDAAVREAYLGDETPNEMMGAAG
ncbi:ATP-binding cassette domain-containing protein [Bordetella sp. FB-8]|uniref:branched-chain amino acid ABC transporter ATP-binding protein/permease n=1 Tax=Bordetella sp. FB-8 TaxID=1159870 RepID=UPI00036FBD9F|nr:branched-chain amino acid ABC transporter ATP-binding protein/permease [Bordetella sp. FB-8]